MVLHQNKSVTLIELILAVSLVVVIILGINSINIFSHYQVISSDRRAKLQNDVSYSLDHITKQGLKAIGNEMAFGSNSAVLAVANTSLAFFTDTDGDGRRNTANDRWIKYTFNSTNHRLSYCGNCSNSACASCTINPVVLSEKITAFTPTKLANFTDGNHVKVQVTGRWDPTSIISTDNPEVKMNTTIQLPSVSIN